LQINNKERKVPDGVDAVDIISGNTRKGGSDLIGPIGHLDILSRKHLRKLPGCWGSAYWTGLL